MNTGAEKIQETFRSVAKPDRHPRGLEDDRSRSELLELIFTHVADAIILAEPDGRIVDANPAACALLGYGRSELPGKYPWDFVTGASRDEILARIRSMKSGVPVSVQGTCRRKDGESRTMDLLLTRVGCPGREMIVASFRDLTERKRAEATLRQSEDTLRLAIDTIPGLVWTSLPDGHIEYLNKRWLDYTGLRQEEAAGWGWQAAIHPEDVLGLVDYWKSILASGEPGEYEARLRRFDGEYRWFLFRGVPLYDEHGRVVKWYGTNTDIEALRASEHLARGQLEALTQTLNALAQESAPEKFLEHVLRTISSRLGAHSISVWELNERTACVELVGQCEDNELTLIPADRDAFSQVMSAPHEHPVWSEFFRSGRHCVIGEITSGEARVRVASGPDTPWHHWMGRAVANSNLAVMMKRLSALGIITMLCVPMFVSGKVTGFLSIRFTQRRDFRDEEIELTRALAHQATLALQSVRLTQLSREAAVAAERDRMARDIHDTLAQGFTGVIVQLEAAEDAQANGLSTEAARHLERASELARESLREARRSVHALRPQMLAGKNLCAAIEELIRKMAGTSLEAEFAIRGEPRPIPQEWEENLLRIGQEALTNTLRHARARHFKARLTFEPRAVRLELRDDGCGFDRSSPQDGLGLLGIRERVEAMSGELTIRSAPENGTTILVALPLAEYSQA